MTTETPQNRDETVRARIMGFVKDIGLDVREGPIATPTFVPGIIIDHGTLVVSPSEWRYPGDLLHEAGHLAVMAPVRRRRCHVDVGKRAAEEMMAIAWSYAAGVYLDLAPEVVFHADGYRGGSAALRENFTEGRYIAVPMLQWVGMAFEPSRAAELQVAPYPHMHRWLREEGTATS